MAEPETKTGTRSPFLSPESEMALLKHLCNDLYDPKYGSVIECLNAFSDWIKNDLSISETSAKSMLCSGISKYVRILTILEQHQNPFRSIFNGYNEYLLKYPLTHYRLTSRCKSLISAIEKMIELIKEGRSLDELKDIIGIRLVISPKINESEEEAQQRLYKVCNDSIAYFIDKGCIPCNAPTLKKNQLQEGIKITIPEESYIRNAYKPFVKDYVFFPKGRGYQSLHVVFCTPEGFYVEFQFRTLEMDQNAEHGPANHRTHKEERYSNIISSILDLKEIKMCGFLYLYKDDNGIEHFIDHCGTVYGRPVYFRDSWNSNSNN